MKREDQSKIEVRFLDYLENTSYTGLIIVFTFVLFITTFIKMF